MTQTTDNKQILNRANGANHPKRLIQKYCMEKLGYTNAITQEYFHMVNSVTCMNIGKSLEKAINSVYQIIRRSLVTA